MLKKPKTNSNRNTSPLALRRQALGLFSVPQNFSGAEVNPGGLRKGRVLQSFGEAFIANERAHLLIISKSIWLDLGQICYGAVLNHEAKLAIGKAEALEILKLDQQGFGTFIRTKINKTEKAIRKKITEADPNEQFGALISWASLKLETLTFPDISKDISKIVGEPQRRLVVCIDLLDQLVKHLQALDERAILGLYDLLEHPAITIVGGTSPQGYKELEELEPQVLSYFQCLHLL
jgi:hypothetical protein